MLDSQDVEVQCIVERQLFRGIVQPHKEGSLLCIHYALNNTAFPIGEETVDLMWMRAGAGRAVIPNLRSKNLCTKWTRDTINGPPTR